MNTDAGKSDLEKRILEYSTVAGIILAGASSSLLKGAVHKSTPNVTNQTHYGIDFDGVDRDLSISLSTSNHLIVWDDGDPIGYAGTRNFASVLNSGALIGPGMNFIGSALAWNGGGPWLGVSNKFLGVEFLISSTPYYGWVKISVHSNYTFDVHEFAYEDVQGRGILAGSDVSLPVELNTLSAVIEETGVKISWATESETDNLGFILERQRKGEADWITIASYENNNELKGQGNTSGRTEYVFTDTHVFDGDTYIYRLSDVDFNGNITVKEVVDITVTEHVIPNATELLPAVPNPFNPNTKIRYQLAEGCQVTLRVVDILGQTVDDIIINQYLDAGNYVQYWNGKNRKGQSVPNGVYILVLNAGSVNKTEKVMFVK
ncbi:T9SS type A sorting domain-containing protein [bacterium]|nr:T9SS type A sorting domain-containing protein [bacterium]